MHSKDHGACVRPCGFAPGLRESRTCVGWMIFLDVEKRNQQFFMFFFKGVEYETQERDGLYDASEIQHKG